MHLVGIGQLQHLGRKRAAANGDERDRKKESDRERERKTNRKKTENGKETDKSMYDRPMTRTNPIVDLEISDIIVAC